MSPTIVPPMLFDTLAASVAEVEAQVESTQGVCDATQLDCCKSRVGPNIREFHGHRGPERERERTVYGYG